MSEGDTIAAIATPPGKGGVGIVRVSGKDLSRIIRTVVHKTLKPRQAHFCVFKDANNHAVDEGLALYFNAPHSFTGEDVLELQGHGGPVVLNEVLNAVLAAGARVAEPGEFSRRAFLNNKIDLTQAEAIADLIDADSKHAARCAMRSLQGEFSQAIQALNSLLIKLRLFVEAAIDFPEEDVEFIQGEKIIDSLQQLAKQLVVVMETAEQGVLLREGMTVVISGRPNAGKSSLLNALSGEDRAIVTDIPGTTRDLLREHIHIDGLPLHIVDTAGLHDSADAVEQEGIKRAHVAIRDADLIILLVDAAEETPDSVALLKDNLQQQLSLEAPMLVVYNKMDLLADISPLCQACLISAKQGEGIEALKQTLKDQVGYCQSREGIFIARTRHLQALSQAQKSITHGIAQFQSHQASELLAEDLRVAQQYLNTITGEFSSDDLLGEIFSNFCIGK